MVAVMQRPLDMLMQGLGAPLRLVYASNRIDLPGVYTKPARGAALFHQSTLNNLLGVDGLSATAGIRFDYEHTGLDYSTESNGGDINMVFQIPGRPMPPIFVEGDTLLKGNFSKDFGRYCLSLLCNIRCHLLPKSIFQLQKDIRPEVIMNRFFGCAARCPYGIVDEECV